jgi:YVTN family beta-propeller protein
MKQFFVFLIIVLLSCSSICSLANNEVANASDSSTNDISTQTNIINSASLPNPDTSLGALANWTVMAYLDGDNNLEAYAIAKFLSMSQTGSTSNVKLVAELDRTSGYDTSYGDWTDTKRFYITSGMTPTSSNAAQDLDEKDMGDPNTLSSFITWSTQNYPANHYLLILFDHGSGVVQATKAQASSEQPLGIIFDDTNNDYLTTPELAQALNSSSTLLDVLYLDACSMGMIEVGYQVAPYADVMVASEEVGWANNPDSVYNTFIGTLVSTPSESQSTLGTSIVNAYVNYWSGGSNQITCSAIDLTKLRSTGLITSTSSFAQTLQIKYSSYITQVRTAQSQSEGFDGPYAGDSGYYIDLYDFADHVNSSISDTALMNVASQVKTDLTAATIISRQYNHPNAHGISIFFPNTQSQYNTYKNTYKATTFAVTTSWDEWLDTYFTTSALDAYEPDNSFSQYSNITVTTSLQSQPRSIEPTNDNDYIRFYATPGAYTFYTSSSIDTYGYLYDSNQNQLTYDDDGGGSLQFYISYQIMSSGYYFLRVRAYSSSVEGLYTLYYKYTTTALDAYEPDNSFSQYSNITVTTSLQSQYRSLEPSGDNDYLRFYATPGTYTFYSSSSIDTYVYLYNSNQTLLASDDDSGGNLQFSISYQITSSGYYFLRVLGYSSSVEGPYTLYFQYSSLIAPTVSASLGTIDQGQTSTLTSTVVITGFPPYTYQWFEEAPGGSYVMIGSNSSSFIFATSGSTSPGNWSFILRVTDSAGAQVNSVAVTVAVNSALAAPTVTATIPVGSEPFGVAIPPNGAYAYVTNDGGTTVSVISTATNTVTATIPVGSEPAGVAVAPNGAHAYVANHADNSVSVIDTATNTVTSTVPVGIGPSGVAVTPNSEFVYVTNWGSGSVSVISTATNTVTATISVGNYSYFITISPNGAYAYVTNAANNSVSVISTATNTVTSTITVGSMPVGVAVSSNGAYVYIANGGDNSVSVISTATNTVTATISVGNYPYCVAINPNGTYAFVANGGDNSVSVISTATNTVTSTITVGSMPVGVAVSSNGAYVYIANGGDNSVSVIRTSALTVSASPSTIYQGQTSYLTSTAVTAGTPPYTYRWFVKAPSGSYTLINGATSSSYNFVSSTSIATGSWSFILQVTDNTGAAMNSTSASIMVNPLTITVTQTANGVIAPGTINVNYGGSQIITITPSTGYYIASLMVDGSSVAVASSYTFSNVVVDHTITATFAVSTYPITVTQTTNGQISPSTTTVSYGSSQTFTVAPNSGYYIASITTDAGSVSVTSSSGQTVSFTNVNSAHSITATFAQTPNPTPTPTPTPTAMPTIAPTSSPNPTPKPNSIPSPSPTTVPATTSTGATVELTINGNVTGTQISSITIATNQSAELTTFSFTVTGQSGTTGFSNITIPKSVVAYGTTPTIYLDGQPASNQGYTQDDNNYFVWFMTQFSTHQVSIVFAVGSSIPEFPSINLLLFASLIISVTIMLTLRKRKKIVRL